MNTQTQVLANDVAKVTRRLYRGTSVMHFRLLSADSGNALSVIDMHMLPGTEPPRHVHDREDETFIIMEGEMTFFIGENMIKAYPGDMVFAPRGVAHSFRIDTVWTKIRLILTPGQLDQFFWQQSVPYSAGGPVAPVGPPSPEAVNAAMRLASGYGLRFI